MSEKLKIKVTIGDRVYPLTINSEKEGKASERLLRK